jgi:hypothetical protein
MASVSPSHYYLLPVCQSTSLFKLSYEQIYTSIIWHKLCTLISLLPSPFTIINLASILVVWGIEYVSTSNYIKFCLYNLFRNKLLLSISFWSVWRRNTSRKMVILAKISHKTICNFYYPKVEHDKYFHWAINDCTWNIVRVV